MSSEESPRAIIARLGLEPHPEGGWYRETWRVRDPHDERGRASAIWFLLEAGQRSHWHRIDAAEAWFWHAGQPIRLGVASTREGPVEEVRLGGDLKTGQVPQYVVPPDFWQSAEVQGGWGLVSCVVSPGFEFAGFTLAPPGWAPGLATEAADFFFPQRSTED